MEASSIKRFGLGIYLLGISAVIVYALISLWHHPGEPANDIWTGTASFLRPNWKIGHEIRLILLVVFSGALGSCIHVATSFATYVGNRSLVDSWYWWYFLRPVIGIALALIFYFAIRGGLLVVMGTSEDASLDPFGLAAVTGLVGMFSKQATDKLSEVFNSLFRSAGGDKERGNKLGEMLPVRDFMLGVNRISSCDLKNGKNEDTVTIKELHDLLKGAVTRIPIFDENGAAKYVIHQSMLFKFISRKSMETAGSPIDVSDLKLRQLLDFEDMRKMVEESLAFVSVDATLGDAKRLMELTENCQDVFVTQNGRKEKPVLGWLTNIDIAKRWDASARFLKK